MRSTTLQKQLDDLWTVIDVATYCKVVPMTVHAWRRKGLPCVTIKGKARPTIRFVPREVQNWCKKNNINIEIP